MNLYFDKSLIGNYRNKSQIARVLTETWVQENIYCPRCGNSKLLHFSNNSAVADFYCPVCRNQYELKSKKGKIGRKISDGAYDTFVQRITSNENPDFFILSYHPENLCVENLWVVPKIFFVPAIVEKRKPLSSKAKRAGWVGCNILFSEIPLQGQISIIKDHVVQGKETVIMQMERATLLNANNIEARGWLFDVLICINRIPQSVFSLEDVYQFEAYLAKRHPRNHNIRPKIRQQLQILRDKDFIRFIERGKYQKVNS